MNATAPGTSPCATRGAFDILAGCHEHIAARVAELAALAEGLERVPRLDEPCLARLAGILAFLDTVIPIHGADEEQTLFPRLRALPELRGAGGHTPMDCMEREHVDRRALLAALKRDLMLGRPEAVARAARGLASSYREHIAREDQVLFPWARERLTDPAVVERMAQEMRERRRAAGLLDGC